MSLRFFKAPPGQQKTSHNSLFTWSKQQQGSVKVQCNESILVWSFKQSSHLSLCKCLERNKRHFQALFGRFVSSRSLSSGSSLRGKQGHHQFKSKVKKWLHTNTHTTPLCILNYTHSIWPLPMATQRLPSCVLHRKAISTKNSPTQCNYVIKLNAGHRYEHTYWRTQMHSYAHTVRENTCTRSLDNYSICNRAHAHTRISQIIIRLNRWQEAYKSHTCKHTKCMSQLMTSPTCAVVFSELYL